MVKKAKRKQLHDKIKKLEDDFKKNEFHNLFTSVRELEGIPNKSLTVVVKNQKKDNITKTGKNILNSASIRNFLMMEISCNPFLTLHPV